MRLFANLWFCLISGIQPRKSLILKGKSDTVSYYGIPRESPGIWFGKQRVERSAGPFDGSNPVQTDRRRFVGKSHEARVGQGNIACQFARWPIFWAKAKDFIRVSGCSVHLRRASYRQIISVNTSMIVSNPPRLAYWEKNRRGDSFWKRPGRAWSRNHSEIGVWTDIE